MRKHLSESFINQTVSYARARTLSKLEVVVVAEGLDPSWLQRRDSERRLEASQAQGLTGQKGFGPKRAPETYPKLLQSNQCLRSVCFLAGLIGNKQ